MAFPLHSFRFQFITTYAQPINHVRWKSLLSKRRARRGGRKKKMFFPKSLLLFWGCTSELMLSLGKLMKMCGIFISCESLRNRNLIAPFSSVVLVVPFFCSGSRREKTTSFQADSSVRSSPFMDFFSRFLPQWLYNRKWRINIWGDQTEQTVCNQLKYSKHAVNSARFSLENNSPANCFQSPIKGTKWLSNLCRHTFVLLKVLQNAFQEINVIKTDSIVKNVNRIMKFERALKKYCFMSLAEWL